MIPLLHPICFIFSKHTTASFIALAIEASKQKTRGSKRKPDPEPFFTYADHPVIKLAPKRKAEADVTIATLQSGSKASPITALIRHSHSLLSDSSSTSGSTKTMQISTPTGNRVRNSNILRNSETG